MQYRTFRYMTQFRCTGPECPDSCCVGWHIPLSKGDFDMIKKRLSRSPEGRAELKSNTVKGKLDNKTRQPSYQLALDGGGRCTFLDQERYCSLQNRFGETVLPRTCSTFPRLILRHGEQTDLAATLACPECARLCLLGEFDPLEWIPFSPELLPRADVFETPWAGSGSPIPYLRHFHAVRAFILHLFSLPDWPLSSRLFFASYFANRVTPFFHRDAAGAVEEPLQEEMARMQEASVRQQLHESLQKVDPPGAVAMNIAQMVVHGTLKMNSGELRFRQLVQQAVENYNQDAGHDKETGMEPLWRGYRKRRQTFPPRLQAPMDELFARFFRNQAMQTLYSNHPNLMRYMRELLIWRVVIRFLLLGVLPPTQELSRMTDEAALERLHASGVEVFQLFSKTVKHSIPLLRQVAQDLDAKGVDSLAHLVFLIKF